MGSKAAKGRRNSENETRDHVLLDLSALIDGEGEDKIAEITMSWNVRRKKKEKRWSNILVASELVESHILAGGCPISRYCRCGRMGAGDKVALVDFSRFLPSPVFRFCFFSQPT